MGEELVAPRCLGKGYATFKVFAVLSSWNLGTAYISSAVIWCYENCESGVSLLNEQLQNPFVLSDSGIWGIGRD